MKYLNKNGFINPISIWGVGGKIGHVSLKAQ